MSWFPVFTEQMEDKGFRSLSIVQKLYYFTLQSEYNYRNPLYMSDDYFGAMLACSTSAIRQARKKLRSMGLIDYRSGYRSNGGQLATNYQNVRWALVRDQEGKFAQIKRHNWNMILDRVRDNRYCHGDAVVYLTIAYWRKIKEFEFEYADDFFITKRKLSELAGISSPGQHIDNLYQKLVFNGGAHLFEYDEEYHRYKFTNWSQATDPEKNNLNARNAERYILEIQKEVSRRRAEEERKRKTKFK